MQIALPATNGDADQEALALLRESATPELYRRNGFRVMELPVDATTKDVNRRKQMMEMAATNGVPVPPGQGRFFPLDPAPDEFSVRDAAQRLGDPERRLVDEFFWFWPHEQGQSRSDQGLQLLAQGNYQRASEIWSQQEANLSVSLISTHNLAVLYHLLALQWESHAISNDASCDQQNNIEQLWGRAFRRWQRLLDEENFWSRLTARVREFEDPRLTAGTVRRLRTALPAALLSINAQLALQAVAQGKKESATRLVQVIRSSGFPEASIKDGLRQAVEPSRVRIKGLCKAAQESAGADPVHADTACRQLLDKAIPILDGLDCLLPVGDPTRDVAHDEVADQVLKCQVAFARKTHGWKVSVELLEMVVAMAASRSLTKTLQENLETVKKNADTNDDFCGEGYYELSSPVLVELEVARGLADTQDFDGAISRLETLLAGKGGIVAQTRHVVLLKKALAYCLGTRGARRRSVAVDVWNAHRPSVIDDITKRVDSIEGITWTCAKMETVPPGVSCQCMADGRVIYGQYSILKWMFQDKLVSLVVCGSCGDRFRRERNSARSSLKEAISKSAQDYADAGELDPANGFVRTALAGVRKECADLEIAMPSPRRRKVDGVSPKAEATSTDDGSTAAGWSLGLGIAAAVWAFAVWNLTGAASVTDSWARALASAWPAVFAVILGHLARSKAKRAASNKWRHIGKSANPVAIMGSKKAVVGLFLGYCVCVPAAVYLYELCFLDFGKLVQPRIGDKAVTVVGAEAQQPSLPASTGTQHTETSTRTTLSALSNTPGTSRRAASSADSATPAEINDAIRTAALRGDTEAQITLGKRYLKGDGVPKDAVEAYMWFHLAAEFGSSKGFTGLYEASQSLSKAQIADGLQRVLQVRATSSLDSPVPATPSDASIKAAAERGDTEAQFTLGEKYLKGDGVPKDAEEAYMWFHLAVERGLSKAFTARWEASRSLSQAQIANAKRRASEIRDK